jgi:hypothetical protein
MQQDEQTPQEDEQYVPHGALADLFDRAERIREAYAELHGSQQAGDATDQQQ